MDCTNGSIEYTYLIPYLDIYTLFIDGSKYIEGQGEGFFIINPSIKRNFMSCTLELDCTHNIIECICLIQGLKKCIDSMAQVLKVSGDSKIKVR